MEDDAQDDGAADAFTEPSPPAYQSPRSTESANNPASAARRLAERLQRIEDEAVGPRSAEALQALEGAVSRVGGDMQPADPSPRETSAGARVVPLDSAGAGEPPDAIQMQMLARGLSAQVDAVRQELARELAATADARIERLEHALAKMNEQVRIAEQRSAAALERMGREVLDVAQALSRRVRAVERRSDETAERVANDATRIVGLLEDRLTRSDALQAKALERLGGEIARITERLAERIAAAERRSARAIDDVGEQVARVTERMGQRHLQSVGELAERIRTSEERTARMLDEARTKIDERLSGGMRRRLVPNTVARLSTPPSILLRPPAEPPQHDWDTASDAEPDSPVMASLEEDSIELEPNVGFDTEGEPPPIAIAEAYAELRLATDAAPQADEGIAETADDDAPVVSEPATAAIDADDELWATSDEIDEDDDLLADLLETEPRPAAATAEVADWSLLADDAADQAPRVAPEHAAAFEDESALEAEDDDAPSAAAVLERARAAADQDDRERRVRLFAAGRPDAAILAHRRRGRITGGLMVASLVAAVGVSASGYLLLQDRPSIGRGKDATHLGGAPALDASSTTPLAALALAPRPTGLAADYAAVVTRLTTGDKAALPALTKLADGGYAPAQFYLGELYRDGKAGLAKDPAQSRRWLQRAADAGDRTAMHNLALDYHDGVGGTRSAGMAAEWFRRAADRGLIDSQYNLAALYEHGDGVEANLANAYKWYLIAAAGGDLQAKSAAMRISASLSPAARAIAERAASDFRPIGVPAADATAPAAHASAADVATAQRVLSQLGYYEGPNDGMASQALHLALAAYQRDKGLPITGSPDATTVQRLRETAQ